MNCPWVLRCGGVSVGGAGRYQHQVARPYQAGFVFDIQVGFPLRAMDQKIVIVVLPVHVVACGAAIVTEGERVQVAGQRMS